MLNTVDYDDKQHAGYVAGRDLGEDNARFWTRIFAAHAPETRPLSVLDLGSGTGRFSTMLAQTFGGDVLGVEPSDRMRRIAIERTVHPQVRFAAGRAEAIPAADASFDIVLMFLSFHHVQDREGAVAEIARVLRPGGRVFIRSGFSDRMSPLDWHAFFPRARAIELQMFPSLAAVEALFALAGLHRTALIEVREHISDTLAEHAERLRHRAISTFEHMREEEIEAGFARLDDAVRLQGRLGPITARSDLLVLARD